MSGMEVSTQHSDQRIQPKKKEAAAAPKAHPTPKCAQTGCGFYPVFALYIHTYNRHTVIAFFLSLHFSHNPHCLDAALPPGTVYYSTELINAGGGWMDGSGGILGVF